MKKTLLAALCAATATFAGQFITWNGADEDPIVKTGFGNETETQGRWYTYEDNLGSQQYAQTMESTHHISIAPM